MRDEHRCPTWPPNRITPQIFRMSLVYFHKSSGFPSVPRLHKRPLAIATIFVCFLFLPLFYLHFVAAVVGLCSQIFPYQVSTDVTVIWFEWALWSCCADRHKLSDRRRDLLALVLLTAPPVTPLSHPLSSCTFSYTFKGHVAVNSEAELNVVFCFVCFLFLLLVQLAA